MFLPYALTCSFLKLYLEKFTGFHGAASISHGIANPRENFYYREDVHYQGVI